MLLLSEQARQRCELDNNNVKRVNTFFKRRIHKHSEYVEIIYAEMINEPLKRIYYSQIFVLQRIYADKNNLVGNYLKWPPGVR